MAPIFSNPRQCVFSFSSGIILISLLSLSFLFSKILFNLDESFGLPKKLSLLNEFFSFGLIILFLLFEWFN